uniref:Ras-related protein Rab-34 n=1 Tax=Aceria tosichella TaxID=561515 RepID=A0A6G1S9Y6_9ACAR
MSYTGTNRNIAMQEFTNHTADLKQQQHHRRDQSLDSGVTQLNYSSSASTSSASSTSSSSASSTSSNEIFTKTDDMMVSSAGQSKARTITTLPLNSPTDYSPYGELEFNLAVQDYCRNKSNHIIPKQQQQQQHQDHPSKGANKFKQTTTYNTVNAPFNKIIRSCKVVVSGDVAVGKTSLINRFGNGVYSSTHRSTIGVDFDLQRFNILGQPYVLQIWDTAGLEMFRCITNAYYRGCHVAIIVFDMSSMSSLASVVKWKEDVVAASKTFDQLEAEYNTGTNNQSAPDDGTASAAASEPLIFLVGTKYDLAQTETSRTFMREQANRIASILQAELWFVSAQTGENVDELFNRIAALSFNRLIMNEIKRIKFETSTMGVSMKEKLFQQRRESWIQANKIIKITKKKDGDDRRTRCVNIQCVIK